ncbi:MAG: trypsin-like peptidase domain-containing protein [Myxococcales bacterium]|nr:trypsin-like peptidase domain-containing protein [Myxococcales bacterium]
MIAAVGPAVVSVDTDRAAPRRLLGSDEGVVMGQGSGFVVDAEGLVVTNHHVVDGARSVRVRLSDGRRFDAEVVGSDPATDLALLRLSGAEDLPVVTLGHSRELQIGDWVVAVGNPMGLDHSATVGIVSGKGRGSLGLYSDSYIDFLQTDADIAPGSSGGPLFDLHGEVVGINTAVGAGSGPGFAIPIDQAKRIIEQLRDRGEVVRGWLGAGNVPGEEGPGAEVGAVYADTPAERAGLRPGDVVEALDGEAIESFEALRARVGTKQPGDEVELRVRRGDETLELRVTLGARPHRDAMGGLRRSSGRRADEPRDESSQSHARLTLPFGLGSPPPRAPEPPPAAGAEGSGLRLGIGVRSAAEGVEVVEVGEGSLGDTLGLRVGDRILEVDGSPVRSPSELSGAFARAGSRLELSFDREGASHRVTFER